MRNKYYTSRDPIKNYFPLPNEVFALGLSPGALAVYSYLMYTEDRTTYQCHASYKTIVSWPVPGTISSVTSMPALRAAAAIVRMLLIDSLSRSPSVNPSLTTEWEKIKQ